MTPTCAACSELITDESYLLTDWTGRELAHRDAVHVHCAETAGTMPPDAAHYTLVIKQC